MIEKVGHERNHLTVIDALKFTKNICLENIGNQKLLIEVQGQNGKKAFKGHSSASKREN